MRREGILILILALFLLLLASACSGGARKGEARLDVILNDSGFSSELLDINSIVDGPRAATVADESDYSLLLDQILQGSNASHTGDELLLSPAGGTAWVIYRVSGFDGDMLPLCARAVITSGSTEFSMGFSDYYNSRWSFAGPYSGTSDIDIPVDGINHPDRLISDYGNMFLAIVANGEEELRIADILLEVFGGSDAPEPPLQLDYIDNEDTIRLNWQASTSESDPDFRGYVLERAPFGGSSYQEIARGWPNDNIFEDTSINPLELYRYRLFAYDSAGNQSSYALENNAIAGLGNPQVLAVLQIKTGTYEGPAEVTFDLSDSHVSYGGSIDTYELHISGMEPLSGPSSTYTLNLQPGCYRIEGRVHSGAIFDRVVRFLRIQPRWREDSVVVSDMQGNLIRNEFSRSAIAADGSIIHCSHDPSQRAVSFWKENGDGLEFDTIWLRDIDVRSSCEPVRIGNVIHFGFRFDDNIIIISHDGNEPVITPSNFTTSSDDFCLAKGPNGDLVLFREMDNGGSLDIVYRTVSISSTDSIVLANVTGGIRGIDAVWNPTADAFDICYGDNIALNWEQWHPLNGHQAGGGLYNFKVLGVDLELDPKSNRSVMLTTLDVAPFDAWYLYQNEMGLWSLPEYPDENTEASRYGDILATEEGTWIISHVMEVADDYQRVYSRVNDSWEQYGEMQTSDFIDYTATLLPGADGGVRACLPLKGGDQVVRLFENAEAPVDLYAIEGNQDGYHGELHAAPGSDGLHAVWLQRSNDNLVHFSSPDGQSWSDMSASIGKVTDVDLASNALGEVYLSFVDVNSTELHYWNGSIWVQQEAFPGVAGFRPSLMSQPTNELMYWYVHLQPANAMRFVEGNQSNPFNFMAINPADPTWQGTVIDGGFQLVGIKPRWFCLSGASLNQSELAFYNYNFDIPTSLHPDPGHSDYPELYGRTIDSCLFASPDSDSQAVWNVNASGFGDSILIKPSEFNSQFVTKVIPVDGQFQNFISSGSRERSVNMAQADGRTALVMEAGITGFESRLFWSNFGEFSEIALPRQLRDDKGSWVSSPEVVVGTDGRWHIIYLDLQRNEMRCVSSL